LKTLKKTENMDRTKWLIFGMIFALIGAHIYSILGKKTETIEIEKTDTIQICDTTYITDTLYLDKPTPVYIEKIKTDTVYTKDNEPIELITEHKIYKDTLCKSNDSIILTNYITGINVTLDSSRVDLRKQEIVNTIEVTKYIKEKAKRWSIGAGVGYGIGLKNKDLEPFLGITIQYNL